MAQIRITGGELRGRRLYVPKAGVRPTTGRVREAIFSMLGSVEGVRALDLYCGSGALGIEALSRGARDATFVDREIDAVTRNLGDLELTAKVERTDVVRWLSRTAGSAAGTPYHLVFCDPPYTHAADLDLDLSAALARIADPDAKLVLETAARKPLDLGLPVIKERAYGDTLVRIHAVSGEDA